MSSILDRSTNMILGKIGEDLPESTEFTEILNLNTIQNNFPFFDILAKKDGEVYVFNVKARKRYGANGKLNTSYHLYKKSDNISGKFSKALELLTKLGYDTSKIHYCFMVVPIEENIKCSYYWGELNEIYPIFTMKNVLANKINFLLEVKVKNNFLLKYKIYGSHDWDTIKTKYFS